MDKKDWMWLIVTIILVIIIIATNIEVKEYPKMKERTETFENRCEIWKICDNVPNLWAPMIPTPDDYTYRCWEEQRNCEPQTQAEQSSVS